MSKLSRFEKLLAIQNEIDVPKTQFNKHGNFYYRSAEDILEALKPLSKKYNVTFFIEEDLIWLSDNIVNIEARAFMVDNEDDSGMGNAATGNALIELNSKGMQMPQRTGAASSYAKKYALGNLLMLDDSKDADTEEPKKESKLKVVGPKALAGLLKAIGEGKFAQVEKALPLYKESENKKKVIEAVKKAKSAR